MTAKTAKTKEIWKRVPGYKKLYKVSSYGRVKSLPRWRRNGSGWSMTKERILEPYTGNINEGYLSVDLYDADGKRKGFKVHRLVLEAFVGPCPLGYECCHFPDREPTNNHVDNLQWLTHKQNMGHKKLHGTLAIGERCGSARLTEAKVRQIRSYYANGGWTMTGLANSFGVGYTTVNDIVNRRKWKHIR